MKKVTKLLKVVMASTMVFSSCYMTKIDTSAASEDVDLVQYTNTIFGTNYGKGSTIAGPTRPNGSIHPSPETRGCDNGGYHKGNNVVGFGQIYSQGTGGQKSYGNFLISPQTGEIKTRDGDHTSPISNERGRADYYTAHLDRYDIKAEVVPDKHSAIYRFTYPKGQEASLVLDVSRRIGDGVSMENGSITIDKENKLITGGGEFGQNWNGAHWNMYVALQFDNDFKEIGTWDDKTLKKDVLTLSKTSRGNHFGGYVKFDTETDQEVNVKVAISYESEEKAKAFLDKEIPEYDLEAEKVQANKAWNEILDDVELGGDVDETTKTKFYTALFHTNVQPRNRVEDHGNWDEYYTIWDSWKTVFPFLQLTRPEMVADNINSFINRFNESGYITDVYTQGKEDLCGQGGNDIENIIGDAYLKKLPGVNWEDAYRVMKGNSEALRTPQYVAKGYQYGSKTAQNGIGYSGRLKPGSATIGFAYDDYAIAMMAKGLGHQEDYEKYIARSKNWLNVWDENMEDEGFTGFAHNRREDGSFETARKATEGWDRDFYEASIWEGSFNPVFDLPTLVEKMGGKYEFAERLNYALSKGYINYGNEPSFQTIWTFSSDEVQRPDLASKWSNEYLKRFRDDGYPGDEDNGAMSSMYMFLMSGFFPMSVTNDYYLHGTHLPEITYHLGNGKDFVIKGVNTGGDNIYVQSAKWNGEALNVSKLTYDQISAGGTLEFVMGSEPSAWGREADNENPSDVKNLTLDNSKIKEGILSLNWDAATDDNAVKEYNVYCLDKADEALSEENKVSTTKKTTYSFEATNKVKYYAVEAVDYAGKKSVNPTVIKVEVFDNEKPVLSGTIEQDLRYANVGWIRLNWEEATDDTKVKEYRVYRGESEDFALTDGVLVETVTETAFTETKKKGTYYYKVCAIDLFGNVSNVLTAKVENETGLTGKILDAQNIALNKTATVSGQTNDGESGPKAIDGSTSTKWCCKNEQSSAAPALWLEIDLGDTYQLNQWIVKHAQAGGERADYNTRDFKFQVKSGEEWLDIDEVVGNTESITDRTVKTFEGRYIRLYITKAAADGQANTSRIYEFELFNDSSALLFDGSLMKIPGITAKVNGQANDKEGAISAIDFDLNTKWSCRNSADDNGFYWLEVKFPGVYEVNSMDLLSAAKENPDYITRDFKLQVKVNGQWVDALDVKGNNDDLYHGELNKPVQGQEFRLLIAKLGSANKDNARVYEFHLYGSEVVTEEKADYSKVDAAIAKVPADLSNFTEESVKALNEALNAVVRDLDISEQDRVDAMADAIEKAIDGLTLKDADYSKVNEAISKAEAIDRTKYTEEGLAKLDAAIKAVVRDLDITKQKEVEVMAKAINDAIDALVLKDADYSKVDEAIAKAEAIDRTKYTEESLAKLDEAVKAVERDLDITEQDKVNAMAKAIEEALAGLVEWIEWLPIGPSEPVIPWTPLEPSKPIVPTTPIEPSTPVDGDKEEGTDTGDTSNAAGMAGLMALAGAVIVSRRRKATK